MEASVGQPSYSATGWSFRAGTEADLRWWTGWTARETRARSPQAAPVVDLDGAAGYVLDDDLESPAGRPGGRSLPTLDPTTMAWKDRHWYLGRTPHVVLHPTATRGDRLVGGRRRRLEPAADGEIVFQLLEDVGSDAVRAVEAEAARLTDWLGDVRFSPGFLPPFQRELAA